MCSWRGYLVSGEELARDRRKSNNEFERWIGFCSPQTGGEKVDLPRSKVEVRDAREWVHMHAFVVQSTQEIKDAQT